MIRGIYTAASGLKALGARQERIANDLTHVQTTGYRSRDGVTRSFPDAVLYAMGSRSLPGPGAVPLGRLGTGTVYERAGLDLSMGSMQHTGRALDAALLEGDTFLPSSGTARSATPAPATLR